jgi:hypothetical protein
MFLSHILILYEKLRSWDWKWDGIEILTSNWDIIKKDIIDVSSK